MSATDHKTITPLGPLYKSDTMCDILYESFASFKSSHRNELAKISGLPQSTISGMESGRINIGVERAKILAKALRVHPAVIVFPGWDVSEAS